MSRSFMRERNLDALILFGMKGRERYDGYLSNEWADGYVVFPLQGEPVHVTWTATRILRRLEQLDEAPWIEDMRVGRFGATAVAILKEKGLANSRIGILGVEVHGPAEGDGIVPYHTWKTILDGAPGASFVEISKDYTARMLVKSEEEIALYRWAAAVGEKACRAMIEAVRPGASEHHVFSEVMRVLFDHGCFAVAPHLNMTFGVNDLGWGHPMWAYRGGKPRLVKKVDLVQAEIFPCYGGIESQQQMAIAVGKVPAVVDELADVARRSLDAGLAVLKPGVTFGELAEAMEVPLAQAGCWHLTPLVHTLAPISRTSATNFGIEQLPGVERYKGVGTRPAVGTELAIEPGMVFAFEPNACRTNFRVNIGGTVLVTKSGAELLNDVPNRLYKAG